MIAQEMWTEDVVLMFHSRSKDAPPGEGVGEVRLPEATFAELAAIPDWRRLLSNFAESPFLFKGLRWKSVEHAFQAAKFEEKSPDYYRKFCLDSESELAGTLGGAVKSAGGKKGLPLTSAELDWWHSVRFEVMEAVLLEKYKQNDLHRRVLLATKRAKLTHKPARSKHTQVEIPLMKVRAALQG